MKRGCSRAGLFQGVIEQSGTATAPWALYRPPLSSRNSTVYLAEQFDCPTSSSQQMVDCLRGEEADDLVYTFVPVSKQHVASRVFSSMQRLGGTCFCVKAVFILSQNSSAQTRHETLPRR